MYLLPSIFLVTFLKLTFVSAVQIKIDQRSPYDPGVCDRGSRGKLAVVKDRQDQDRLLLCARNSGQGYRWRMTKGNSYGNYFDPGNDCTDILDNVPGAKDGVFWTKTKKGPRKVWCDFLTDGGGFMLIGVQNSPVTLDVPSDPSLVRPRDSRHWSSAFGNKKILDFRVQIASSKSFADTKAHWYYRFNSPRKLSQLLLFNKHGCSKLHPGIGDVKFVKDLRGIRIATSRFKCSRFSSHFHKSFGWGKMNKCFAEECRFGFAHIVSNLSSDSGSFSYSARSSKSGLRDNSTAFIGCQNKQCCACFGPSSDKDYCRASKCEAINGGTVLKGKDQVHVWFWVRTSLPKRVWKKCMEYIKNSQGGKLEKWHVDEETGVPIKGPCSYVREVKLTDGVAVVNNQESFTNLPKVSGLLSYRSDSKKLYLRGNSSWRSLAINDEMQKELAKIRRYQKSLSKELQAVRTRLLYTTHKSCQTALGARRQIRTEKNGLFFIRTYTAEGYSKVYCRMTSLPGCSGGGWTLVMKINGRKETFHYDSSYWYNKQEYNPSGGLSGLDDVETKLATYWSTSFTQLCVGMKVGSNLKFVSIPYSARSLYDLIANGKYRSTNLGRNTWKSLISGSSLQPNCNKEGFNVRGGSGIHARVRIGIITNEQNDCHTPDSYLGFGALERSQRHDDCHARFKVTNTCGNVAACGPTDNGDKAIQAMGYIFVR